MRNTSPSRRAAAGFSLVEVTLALGIVTFALVGVVGVLPVAMVSSRQSIDKNRAAAIADTLYASFRSQPFQSVCYLDSQFDDHGNPLAAPRYPLDLNSTTQADPSSGAVESEVRFYATFLDGNTQVSTANDALAAQRRLRFAATASGGADYVVKMHFNNQPDGTVINPNDPTPATPTNTQHAKPAQANQVELIISPTGRPADQCHFVSVVANRTN